MKHALENPAWNALISGNSNLSNGTGAVRYFDADVSPFVGLEEFSEENFSVLYKEISHNHPLLIAAPIKINIPTPWKLLNYIQGWQMVYNGDVKQEESAIALISLTEKHVSQMVALAKLTNPGPFGNKTINFGHYQGVFEGSDLVAMAGQRFHIFDHAEISAVCTHPDHLGKGYAKRLLLDQIMRIKVASNIPILHVRQDNERAIKIYESIGFAKRSEMNFHLIRKN